MSKRSGGSLAPLLAVVAATMLACDGSRRPAPAVEAGMDAAPSEEVAPPARDAGPPADAADTGAVVDTAPVEEVGTFELPRVNADPKLTRRLLPGAARLVGGERSSCSHAPGATGDRWCAFSRPTPSAPPADAGSAPATELWVMNLTMIAAGAPVTCDGTSANCLRLTTNLWTGVAVFGDSHPSAHRFEGDTLIFHADAGPGPNDPYQGAIYAWQPGWTAARKLTSDRALLCAGEHESAAVVCIDDPVIDKDPSNPFDRPRLRELDLRAGRLDDGATTGPLPLVGRLQQPTGELVWRARFTKDGGSLLYSVSPGPGLPEALFAIKTADIGKTAATPVLADVADWEIANDGSKLYFLRGYDRSRGADATGTLMLADWAPGLQAASNPVALQASVLWYELIGTRDEVFSDVDRGVLFAYPGAGGRPTTALMRDRGKPTELHVFSSKAEVAQVATDARHTLTFQELRGAEFPVAFISHNDGTGSCQLTSDYHAESYGGTFSDSARQVFWIEFGRNQSESEEGWYAAPATCGDKVKFGDFVSWYTPLGDDFVVFEGGDLADSTTWLEYTSLRPARAGAPNLPRLIQERPDGIVGVVATGASIWTLYGVASADDKVAGLYLHGPLGHPTP